MILLDNMNNFSFQDFRDLIESIVLVVGIPLVLIQIVLLKKQLKYQTEWDKKNVTFEYIDKYTNELKDINKKIIQDLRLVGQKGKNLSNKKHNKLLNDASFRTDIMRIVAYFDHLALGIKNDYFDNHVAENSLIVMVIETYKAIQPYIEFRRKELDVEIASNFEELYNIWKNRI